MSYIGNTPTTQNFISGTDYFNGTGAQTAFTLSRTVASINDIQAVVNNVVQVPNDAYTISGTTITFTSAPSAGTQNVYVRYLSTTTQAITPSQNTVSWNTLDSNIQQDLGVMYKNRIINGNMVIDQRNAGAASTGQGYLVDRWRTWFDPGTYSFQQVSDAPTGFTSSLRVTKTNTTQSSYAGIVQYIEGFNTADLAWGTANAKTITLSFWVKSSITGTFTVALGNSAENRWYGAAYTINSANTWEYKSVTVAGDTSGTWVGATNGIGLQIWFNYGQAATAQAAGVWTTSADARATSGSTNLGTTNNATWQITGVQLEVGTQATAFSTAGGSYGAELALCYRYFIKTNPTGAAGSGGLGGSYYGTTNAAVSYNFPVTMRAAPTVVRTSAGGNGDTFWVSGITASSAGTSANVFTGTTGMWQEVNGMSTSVIGQPAFYNGSLQLSAEL